MKKEFKKKEVSTTSTSGITGSDLFKAVEMMKGGLEKTHSEMVKQLFSKEKLLMTSRLSETYIYYIIKHLIISRFFVNMCEPINIEKHIESLPKYPYYKIISNDNTPSNIDDISEYRAFIDELLMLPISKDGMGRNEILSIIKAAEDKLREMELIKQARGGLNRILE